MKAWLKSLFDAHGHFAGPAIGGLALAAILPGAAGLPVSGFTQVVQFLFTIAVYVGVQWWKAEDPAGEAAAETTLKGLLAEFQKSAAATPATQPTEPTAAAPAA
jgi:hypothetical protein